MVSLTQKNIWQSLEKHSQELNSYTHNDFLRVDNNQYTAASSSISLDYSKQRIIPHTVDLLIELANECALPDKIAALMQGEKLNYSENRPALHTALRSSPSSQILVDGEDIIPGIIQAQEQMKEISEQIRNHEWLGFTGKAITDLVNIGMGGSDLGPRFCIHALADFSAQDLGYHFISDANPWAFKNTVAQLNPETTLFIVSSKSFTTPETLYNAKKALDWLGNPRARDKHFIAITANHSKALEFGISNTIPIWDWVGGRYSLCSAINLITCIAIGHERFQELLLGARSMDDHFSQSEFQKNLPVLLALLGLWNINFLNISNLLLLSYAQQLDYFVPYIQQLDMESNGKSSNNKGQLVNFATGPIVWGGPGNQAQHSYYQSLCQGTNKVAADFITLKSFDNELINTLSTGNRLVLARGVPTSNTLSSYIPGNTPLNHLELDNGTPFSIGALVALYEHKVFTQSVIWDINPFDQPGVESAKRAFQGA